MKTLKIRDKIAALRRTYPKIDAASRYLYSGRLDRRKSSSRVAVHIVAWSDDGRVTLHRTEFHKPNMRVREWAEWLREHASSVIGNQVRTYMNRTFGSVWHIEQIFGWHLVIEANDDDTE